MRRQAFLRRDQVEYADFRGILDAVQVFMGLLHLVLVLRVCIFFCVNNSLW